jgi:hypothetical protein
MPTIENLHQRLALWNDYHRAASATFRKERDELLAKVRQLEKENRLLDAKLMHANGLLQQLESFMTRTNNWQNLL